MFTGLIQSLGQVSRCDRHQVVLLCPDLVPQLAIGDSVAVNGVCLTVAEILSTGFVADVSPETLSRSNLGQLAYADHQKVNLEMALAVGDKLGGHFVSGHIDGVGIFGDRQMQGGAWKMSFTAPEHIARYIVEKGSIAINGVSLTVAECNDSGTWFSTAVIPHTYQHTNLSHLAIGSSVNLEADILGKYVEKFLNARIGLGNNERKPQPDNITSDFLAEHGWM